MNFSDLSHAANFTPAIDSSTPLSFARPRMTAPEPPMTLSAFVHYLTAIRDGAYLCLLPQNTQAEVEFHQAELWRLSHGPLGDHPEHLSNLFDDMSCNDMIPETTRQKREFMYEAIDRIMQELADLHETYLNNMTILYAEMLSKWDADIARTGSFVLPLPLLLSLLVNPPSC